MPETKRPLKVFLCHAHSDAAAVRALYLRLRREGVDAWLDKEKLLPGAEWEYEIRKAVREADVVVVCLSKQFNQAGFRQKEVRLALDTAMEQPEGEIFIIPARLEECENLESLRKWHWVDLFEVDGYHKLIRALRARADRIGATLRIRRGGQSITSHPKNKEPEKSKETIASEKDVKSGQEKRVFYELTAHYECDFENTTAETLANFLLESLTKIMRTATDADKSGADRTVEYQTSQVEYFDPKDGKTTQHALIVHGKKVQIIGMGDLHGVAPLTVVPEMLIITMTQGVNGSRLRFDSDELPNEAFKDLVEWILLDLGKDAPFPAKDATSERELLPKQDQLAIKEQVDKVEQEKLGREVAEKARIEKAEREAAEKAEREKVNREVAEKARQERAVQSAAQAATLKKNFSKAMPFLRIGGILGIIFLLFRVGSWAIPQILPLTPTPKATTTQRPVVYTKTIMPSATATKTRTPTSTSIPAAFNPHLDSSDYIDAYGVPMRLVPAGGFTMGSDSGAADEKPVHQVYLDAFYMDIYEVTNAAYKACVDAGACNAPRNTNSFTHTGYYGASQFDDYPVIYVDWNQAQAYCQWRGASLPTEAQWEKAARGTDRRTYPWGKGISCNQANYRDCVGDTNAVGSYSDNVSPYGAYDMAGNIWEWVQDWYAAEYYSVSLDKNPFGPDSGVYHVVRGGAWDFSPEYVTTSDRFWGTPDSASNNFGFRCAKDAATVTPRVTLTSTKTLTPVITPTFTPILTNTPEAPASGFILISIDKIAYIGGKAKAQIRTQPGTQCSLVFYLPSGKISTAPGVGNITADKDGYCAWSWSILGNVNPGYGTVVIIAGGQTTNYYIKIE